MSRQVQPHARLLRSGRFSERGRPYIVTAVTWRRERIFVDLRLGRLVVRALRFEADRERAQTLAYVVMPDHLHWLFELACDEPLHRIIQGVKSYSAWTINQARGTAGAKVWQPGFHDHAVRREEDLRALARYIVANPLRAGIVDDIGRYPLWDAAWLE